MGQLINGTWTTENVGRSGPKGRFQRTQTAFHGMITADGSSGFEASAGRYHIYVAHACPWAHRTMVARKLKRLEDVVSVSVVDPFMGEDGWQFSEARGAVPDTVNGARFLREIYIKARADYSGARHGPGPVGQGHGDDRQQRIGRDHSHVQCEFRRPRQ